MSLKRRADHARSFLALLTIVPHRAMPALRPVRFAGPQQHQCEIILLSLLTLRAVRGTRAAGAFPPGPPAWRSGPDDAQAPTSRVSPPSPRQVQVAGPSFCAALLPRLSRTQIRFDLRRSPPASWPDAPRAAAAAASAARAGAAALGGAAEAC